MATLGAFFTGNQFQEGGPNGTVATPQSGYQNTAPGFQTSNYGNVINQSALSALGGNAQGNASAAQQQALDAQLQGVANGTGASVADKQLALTTQQNQLAAAGAAGSQVGINPELARRQIQNQAANLNQQGAGQAALLRSQESLGALSALGQNLGTQRSQDIGQQGANTALLNAGAGAQGQQNTTALGGQQLQQQTDSQNADLQQQAAALNAGVQQQNVASGTQAFGALAGMGGAFLGSKAVGGKAHGGLIPGRAPVAGDSSRNDVVPALLSPGEVVVPRSVAHDPKKRAAFLAAVDKKSGDGANTDYTTVLALKKRVAALEQKLKGRK